MIANKYIIRIMVFPLDDNFVFGDNFFFLADNFFFAEGDKKNYSAKKKTPTFFHLRSLRKNVAKYSTKGGHKKYYSPKIKKIIHQQTKLLIQRKHHYTFDMTFLCLPSSYYFSRNQQTFSIPPLMLYRI